MAKKLANGDDIFRVEGKGDQLYTIGEAGIYKYDSNSLKGFDRSKASDYSVLSSVDTENLFKSIVDEGSKRYNIDSDYGGYGNEAGVGGLGNRVSMAQATSYLGRSPLGTLPTRAQELQANPGLIAGQGSSPSSQYPGAGQTVGDLFTNPSNGATYNWRTGALVNDPSGQAIARGQGGSNNPMPQAQAPNNPSMINTGIGSSNMPTNSPSYGNPSGAIAGTSGMGTMLDTLMKQNTDNEKARVAEVAKQDTANQSMLDKLLGSTKSPIAARNAAQSETGITPANYFAEEKAKIAEIGSLTEEYNATKAAMEQQIALTYDKLGSNNFINNQQAQITRNAAPKLNMMSANINSKAAVLQALQGRFNEAQSYVNQAVADSVSDYKYKMEVFSTFYQMNQDSINRLDSIYKDAFTTSMSLAEVAYNQQYAEKTAVGELMINPDFVGAGISINDTLGQAQTKAAKWLQNNPSLSTQYQQAQIANIYADNSRLSGGSSSGSSGSSGGSSGIQSKADIKAIQTQLNANGANLVVDGIMGPKTQAAMKAAGMSIPAGSSSDPFIQTLLNSKGGKDLTATFISKIDKGLVVLSQLGTLQENIAGTNTGPILGLFRGANPWETNAQTIKAQLNAIVPNLARGVYGEVGVLTDNDIKLYSKTLPTLTSTEAIRNAVLYITLDTISKSIKTTLSTNAAAGRDVSGFVDIYQEMESTKNSILSTIKSGTTTNQAPQQNVLQSIWSWISG